MLKTISDFAEIKTSDLPISEPMLRSPDPGDPPPLLHSLLSCFSLTADQGDKSKVVHFLDKGTLQSLNNSEK